MLTCRGKGKTPGNETGKEKQWQAQQEVLAERRAKREAQLEAQERGRVALEKEMDRREAAAAKAASRRVRVSLRDCRGLSSPFMLSSICVFACFQFSLASFAKKVKVGGGMQRKLDRREALAAKADE